MKEGYEDLSVICPIYKKEVKINSYTQRISCQGWDENTTISVTFGSSAMYKNHKYSYCKGNFVKCPVFKLLENSEK